MKKILLIIFILITVKVFPAPSSTMSIVPIAVDSRAIKATDENARNNIVATIYNAHDHTTMVSDTITIGTGTVGNIDISSSVNITVDVSGTVTPTIRFNTTTSVWEISNDGNTFLTISTE